VHSDEEASWAGGGRRGGGGGDVSLEWVHGGLYHSKVNANFGESLDHHIAVWWRGVWRNERERERKREGWRSFRAMPRLTSVFSFVF
jgi:hypothetical protein